LFIANACRRASLGLDLRVLDQLAPARELEQSEGAGQGASLDEAQIEALIAERRAARAAGDYAAADRIRARLRDSGILLEDLADRTVWRRTR